MIYFRGSKIESWDNFGMSNVHINSIAQTLSNICHFNGATGNFFSVAEHSVLVSNLCPCNPKEALLHDAIEAFTGDIIRPMQDLLIPDQWLKRRCAIEKVLNRAFNICLSTEGKIWESVKAADNLVLEMEIQYFFHGKKSDLIVCMQPEAAYESFINRWEQVK